MEFIFRILTLCHIFGLFGWVISDSCGSYPFQSTITLLVSVDHLNDFLATTKQSEESASSKYFYSKDDKPCSKDEDCTDQKCCREKTPKCNGGTKKCDCFDLSSNKFTGRPLIYLENSGKCGDKKVGCTMCLDLYDTLRQLGLGQGQSLQGNGSALALSTNGNETSLKEDDFERNVDIITGLFDGSIHTNEITELVFEVVQAAAELASKLTVRISGLGGGLVGALLGNL